MTMKRKKVKNEKEAKILIHLLAHDDEKKAIIHLDNFL